MVYERKISAGNYDLNKWLYGGYEKDIITTIYGPAGSGKTNFCLFASVSQAKKNNKVIYIDTEGGFSIERIKQLVNEKEAEQVLRNILLLTPVNFQEQEEAFSRLLKELKQDRIGLIVVDGMTMLYRLDLAEAKQEREHENMKEVHNINSKLVKQMRILAEIARKKNIPIIITNQVYSGFLSQEELKAGKQKETRMVGGDILKYWSKCIIELVIERGKRKAILRKHRSLKEKEMSFEITNSGIKKKGWI